MRPFPLAVAALVFVGLGALATGCRAAGGEGTVVPSTEVNVDDGPRPDQDGTDGLTAAELSSRIVELDTALDVPEWREGPQPVAVSIPSIGVDTSPVDGVGVEPNGELEVPAAERVGWYRYGSSPGQAGSSVLAAHIAFDGVDGAFRHLDRTQVGDLVRITFDDGTSQSYEIIERAQYNKNELPLDRVFARDGRPVVTLITCGGDFQPSVAGYTDNVVAYAVPVTP